MNRIVSEGRLTTILVLLVLSVLGLQAQTRISGVVNQYVQVTDVVPCDSLVRVGNPTNFVPGDRVLLIQMKGAQISNNNDPSYGTIEDISGAGAAEMLTIKRVDGEVIEFTTRLVHRYDVSGQIQLVRVPVYEDAIVEGTLTAKPWNSTIGGVLAIEVTGNLYLRSSIDVSGMGFTGGIVSPPISRCHITGYTMNWAFGQAGGKGEGITIGRATNQTLAGRGPLANGGGGGNGNNAGGAGGGNGGAGGHGGDANLYCAPDLEVGGLPGNSLSQYVLDQRFFMGGGGGGAHQNDLQGTGGKNGGGIVIIRAGLLHGEGRRILANGSDVLDTADMDAAGGGGAGGTVLLDVGAVVTPVNVSVRGGNGGHVKHLYNAHGPGGGGGGGVVILTERFPTINMDLSGGLPGTHLNPSNEAYRQSRNATPGEEGSVFTDFVWKRPISIELDAWGGGPICEGVTSAVLEATPGFEEYLWSNGMTSRSITVTEPGTYSVTAIDAGGCRHTAGGIQVWYNSTEFSIPNEVDFGAVSLETTQTRTIPVRNEDDEDITLFGVANSANFRVIQPVTFPVVIPAGRTLQVSVEFYAAFDQEFAEDLLFIFDAPCPDTQSVRVKAIVSPIWATFRIPDLEAAVGDTNFEIPIYVDIRPDTAILNATHLRVSLTMDSRVFHPMRTTNGVITTNMIDLLTNTRTLTIELDSIDLRANDNFVTSVVGQVLMSPIGESVIEPYGAVWVKVWQVPITDYDPGSLLASETCFQGGRLVKIYTMPTMEIAPNPVSDVVTVTANVSVLGTYTLKVTDMEGRSVYEEHLWHGGQRDEAKTVPIDVAEWPSGMYVLRFSTPFAIHTRQLVVQH